jgi:hypothetical protein
MDFILSFQTKFLEINDYHNALSCETLRFILGAGLLVGYNADTGCKMPFSVYFF